MPEREFGLPEPDPDEVAGDYRSSYPEIYGRTAWRAPSNRTLNHTEALRSLRERYRDWKAEQDREAEQ
jgi:hypothetical protein